VFVDAEKLKLFRAYIYGGVFLLVAAALVADGRHYVAIPFGLLGFLSIAIRK